MPAFSGPMPKPQLNVWFPLVKLDSELVCEHVFVCVLVCVCLCTASTWCFKDPTRGTANKKRPSKECGRISAKKYQTAGDGHLVPAIDAVKWILTHRGVAGAVSRVGLFAACSASGRTLSGQVRRASPNARQRLKVILWQDWTSRLYLPNDRGYERSLHSSSSQQRDSPKS